MSPKRLKKARLRLKMTQMDLAKKLVISRRMLQSYESGEFPIPREFEYAVYWLLISDKLKKVFLKRFFG